MQVASSVGRTQRRNGTKPSGQPRAEQNPGPRSARQQRSLHTTEIFGSALSNRPSAISPGKLVRSVRGIHM